MQDGNKIKFGINTGIQCGNINAGGDVTFMTASAALRGMSPERLWDEQEQNDRAIQSELKQKWTALGLVGGFWFAFSCFYSVWLTFEGKQAEATTMLALAGFLPPLLMAYVSSKASFPVLDNHRAHRTAIETELSRQGASKRRQGSVPPPWWVL